MSTSRVVRVVVRRTASSVPRAFVVETGRVPGESVHGAAVRRLAEVGVVGTLPWAVDLSGSVALLAVDVSDAVPVDGLRPIGTGQRDAVRDVPAVSTGFRPMGTADLPDLVRWTTAPHVARWWDRESVDLATAREHYGSRLSGEDPTRMWVFEVNGRSVGFAQHYRIGDHPDYALLTAKPDAIGLDYALGDPTWVGRGVGTRLLWELLRDVVRPHHPDAATYFAAPDHRNAASLRVLDKLGFERGLWFDEPEPGGGVATVVGCTFDVPAVLGPAAPARHVTGG